MITQRDLADAFRHLTAVFAHLEEQPGGPERVANIRRGLHAHVTQLAASLSGRAEKCRVKGHEEQLAHNCPSCAGEAKGRRDDETPWTPPTRPEPTWTRRRGSAGRLGQMSALGGAAPSHPDPAGSFAGEEDSR